MKRLACLILACAVLAATLAVMPAASPVSADTTTVAPCGEGGEVW